jgi:hypothetical protein
MILFDLILYISSESQEVFMSSGADESLRLDEIDVPMHEIPKEERWVIKIKIWKQFFKNWFNLEWFSRSKTLKESVSSAEYNSGSTSWAAWRRDFGWAAWRNLWRADGIWRRFPDGSDRRSNFSKRNVRRTHPVGSGNIRIVREHVAEKEKKVTERYSRKNSRWESSHCSH